MLILNYAECVHSPITVLGLRKTGAIPQITSFTTNCSMLMSLLTPFMVKPSYMSDIIEQAKMIARNAARSRKIRYKPNWNIPNDRYQHSYILCFPMADYYDFLQTVHKVVNWWFYAQISPCNYDNGICRVKTKGSGMRYMKCPSDERIEKLFRPALISGSKEERKKLGFIEVRTFQA